jgi:ABC-type transporter Mla MlaB component
MPKSEPPTIALEAGNVRADAWAIEALARLQLEARKHGCQVKLKNASDELRDLLAFMGLEEVLLD